MRVRRFFQMVFGYESGKWMYDFRLAFGYSSCLTIVLAVWEKIAAAGYGELFIVLFFLLGVVLIFDVIMGNRLKSYLDNLNVLRRKSKDEFMIRDYENNWFVFSKEGFRQVNESSKDTNLDFFLDYWLLGRRHFFLYVYTVLEEIETEKKDCC